MLIFIFAHVCHGSPNNVGPDQSAPYVQKTAQINALQPSG